MTETTTWGGARVGAGRPRHPRFAAIEDLEVGAVAYVRIPRDAAPIDRERMRNRLNMAMRYRYGPRSWTTHLVDGHFRLERVG